MSAIAQAGAHGASGPGLARAGAGGVLAKAPADGERLEWRSGGGDADRTVSIVQIFGVLTKNIGFIILGFGLVLSIGVAMIVFTKPAYTASSTLQIDRDTAKVVSTEDPTPTDNFADEFFQTQYGLLKSRALAERVADNLALARDDGFIAEMAARTRWASKTPAQRREAVVDILQKSLLVTPVRGSRLVQLTFTSPSPTLSARIANAFADNFIAAALDRRYEASTYARDFLERRLAQVRAKLDQSEKDLVAYAASQQIIQLPSISQQPQVSDTGPSLAGANLASFNTSLAAARTERIRAEEKWRQAQAMRGFGLTEILQSPTYQILNQEHAKEVADYQDKLRQYKADYPEMARLRARIDETQRQIAAEAANVRESLRVQYEAALANERALQGQVQTQKSAVLDLRGRGIRYTMLQRDVETNRQLYDGLLQRYKEVGVAGGIALNNISVVDRAEPPITPSRPKPTLILVAAAILGLGFGLGLAMLREIFDQAVRTPADLERVGPLPVLGAVPYLKSGQPKAALSDSRSRMAESFHALRASLQFTTEDGFPNTLLVTSALPKAGKTTTAFSLARLVARLGFRVLLVDADLRSPSIHGLINAQTNIGLSSLLTGAATLAEATQATGFPNLSVVVAGPPAPNPAELLAGARLAALVAQAAAAFDVIVFDGPPVMGLADAPLIGATVKGYLLVAESGHASRWQLRQAIRQMEMSGGRALGTVLNKDRSWQSRYGYKAAYGYGYGYGYGYSVVSGRAIANGFSAFLGRFRSPAAG